MQQRCLWPRGRRRRHGGAAAALLILGAAALLQGRPAAARIEIITGRWRRRRRPAARFDAYNPSPFAAVDPNTPKFVVGLYEDAAKAPAAPAAAGGAQHELMTAPDGVRYNCTLPAARGDGGGSGGVAGGGSGSGGAAAAAEVARVDPALPPAAAKSPFDLLEPLTALCLYHKDATWTYEVCHRSRVLQFRKNGAKREEEFSCGAYNGDDAQDPAIREDTSASGQAVRYVVHTYSSGAGCHLTGRPRTAEVRYTCLRGLRDNAVASVREFPTCNYVVVVSTPLLCGHPAFKPPPEDVRLISCVPLGGGGKDTGGKGGKDGGGKDGGGKDGGGSKDTGGKDGGGSSGGKVSSSSEGGGSSGGTKAGGAAVPSAGGGDDSGSSGSSAGGSGASAGEL
ncbi:hypothetical protein Rsub_07700 [Raphidocelis subcapitata]|uniref:MRH domain-containing protein n=1 Tax=Raphidocelis subcapitata TaxID=307507 RepID=A0A2V0P5J2_9CHLO|nr:hypothetical protein Rsub_07700 [Raphidocelis subcapitata]|eukprot:GBF95116.1 hypothetical protein Rsub_07700 [Raphidocelis subcapitata]